MRVAANTATAATGGVVLGSTGGTPEVAGGRAAPTSPPGSVKRVRVGAQQDARGSEREASVQSAASLGSGKGGGKGGNRGR
eukprot:9914969-Alexandrium_andersonii.AAC.1